MTLSFFKNTPRLVLGVFFVLAACLAHAQDEDEPRSANSANSDSKELAPPPAARDIRFMSYNLKNYLSMEIYRKGGIKEKRPKKESEIEALIDIIVLEKPDVLGICEIGTPADLSDLQARLKTAGLDLPHHVHAGGFDRVRHLAILSAFPILKNNSEHHLPFQIGKVERLMGRGILSALIDLPAGPTHFVGLHLKSKRPLKELDESEIRLHEARLAKAHCDAILSADANARVILYGDMNDTRKTPSITTLMGRSNGKNYLDDVFVSDSRDHLWTHYWSHQQQYARLDYVFTSRAITGEVDLEKSYLSDTQNWNDASDHRAVIITFKTKQ